MIRLWPPTLGIGLKELNMNWYDQYYPAVRLGTWDENIFKEMIQYAPLDIQEGEHVLDLGAHIGAFSLWALSSGAESISAYEADELNAELFQINTRAYRNIKIDEYAVIGSYLTEENQAVSLYKTPQNSGMTSLFDRPGSIAAGIPWLKPFIQVISSVKDRPTVMKVDVEGSELYYPWAYLVESSITRFVVEWHLDINPDARQLAKNCHQVILNAGYECYIEPDWTHGHQQLGFYRRTI